MAHSNDRRHPASNLSSTIGTVASWHLLETTTDQARQLTRAWVDYFAAALGDSATATAIGKAAVKFACDNGRLPVALADVSPTTLNKRLKAGAFTPEQAKTVRAIWSIETRARQLEAASKATAKATDAESTSSTPTTTNNTPTTTNNTPTTTNKRSLPTLKADRTVLSAILADLTAARLAEDWQAVETIEGRLSAVLA